MTGGGPGLVSWLEVGAESGVQYPEGGETLSLTATGPSGKSCDESSDDFGGRGTAMKEKAALAGSAVLSTEAVLAPERWAPNAT